MFGSREICSSMNTMETAICFTINVRGIMLLTLVKYK
jgi:hypothetical protein